MNTFLNIIRILAAAMLITAEVSAMINRTYKSRREFAFGSVISTIIIGCGLLILSWVEW